MGKTSTQNNNKNDQFFYGGHAAKGATWNIGMAAANKIITLIGQFALAWLLSPEDMGLAGMAVAMVGFTTFLSAGGVGDVLLQRGRYKQEAAQGLWLSAGLSLCVSIIIFFVLIPISMLRSQNKLVGLLLILAASQIFSIANPILGTQLKNRLDFKNLSITHFLEGITYTLCALVFAKMGFGSYALVLPVIPRAIVGASYIIWCEGWPRFATPRFAIIKKLFKPTFSLTLTSFFFGLQSQAPIFLVGLILDPTKTGYFVWGWSVATQAVFLLAINLRNVLMPIFIKMNENSGRQISAVLKSARLMTAVLTLAVGLQALLAIPILGFLFQEKWQPSGPVITWISLGLSLQGLSIPISAWLNAVGNYRGLLFNTAIPSILISLLTIIGAISGGITGAAIGTGVGLILGSMFSLKFIPWKETKIHIWYFVPPFLITFSFWTFIYIHSLTHTNLLWQIFHPSLFLVGSGFVWWHWDDGTIKYTLRKMIKAS